MIIMITIALTLLAIGPSGKTATALAVQGGRPLLSTDSHALLDAARNGIVIRSTRTKGLGAFVGDDVSYKCGDWIGEYTGEVLTRREMETRYWNEKKCQTVDRRWKRSRIKRQQGISGDYVFDMEDDLFLDAEDADISGWCRFMNHACEGGGKKDDDDNLLCNVETRFSRVSIGENGVRTEPRLWFIARRDIESGEEVS
jgi:SET domain